MSTSAIPRSIRLLTMLTDHAAMLAITMLFCVPWAVGFFFQVLQTEAAPGLLMFDGPELYLGLLGFSLYFCKDCIGGRSIGKRLLHLQVVHHADGQVAGPLRCLVRNLFILLWPIELLVALISPNRRIGDRVAGTAVVPYDPTRTSPQQPWVQTGLAVVMAFGFTWLTLLAPIQWLTSGIAGQPATYIEATRNDSLAAAVQQQLSDTLIQEATVVVYDHIQEDSTLKYVSITLHLYHNHLGDGVLFQQLRERTIADIHAVIPAGTYVGNVAFKYQQDGSWHIRTVNLNK